MPMRLPKFPKAPWSVMSCSKGGRTPKAPQMLVQATPFGRQATPAAPCHAAEDTPRCQLSPRSILSGRRSVGRRSPQSCRRPLSVALAAALRVAGKTPSSARGNKTFTGIQPPMASPPGMIVDEIRDISETYFKGSFPAAKPVRVGYFSEGPSRGGKARPIPTSLGPLANRRESARLASSTFSRPSFESDGLPEPCSPVAYRRTASFESDGLPEPCSPVAYRRTPICLDFGSRSA